MQTSTGFHRIRSLAIDGGFVANTHLEFAPGLNCIIGGRGTGKTTIVEFLRFGLNRMPHAQHEKEQVQALSRLLTQNLNSGRVKIGIQTKEGLRYDVTRLVGEVPRVFSEAGEPIAISLPGPLFSAEVYSQSQIEQIAQNPRAQLDLIDSFLREEIPNLQREIDEGVRLLGANADQMQTKQRELDDLREQGQELPDVCEKLKAFDHATASEPDQQLRRAHEAKALRERQARVICEAGKRFTMLRGAVAAVERQIGADRQVLDAASLARETHAPVMEKAAATIEQVFCIVTGLLADTTLALEAGADELAVVERKLQDEHALADREYQELVARSQQEQQQAQQRILLLKRHAELVSVTQRHGHCLTEITRLRQEHQQLLERLIELRETRYRLRLRQVEALNERLAPMVRIRLQQFGDTSAYRELLAGALHGSGIHYSSLLEKIISRIPPENLVALVRDDQAEQLAAELDIDVERARRFLTPLRSFQLLHQLETIDLADRPTIELKDGERYKDCADASTGQKCTAILPLLLLEGEAPLIIDQPEDNLDNAFVFDTVVQSILRVKPSRQLILVTHNPNIPVLGEAERVFVMASSGTAAEVIAAGSVDEMRDHIERLLEGGADAFQRRMKRYGY